MSKFGSIDVKQLKALQKRLEKLSTIDRDKFCKDTTNELSARLLRKVKFRTPVKTGTLRRNWQASEAKKRGNEWRGTIYNPTEYSMYVEYGHRTRGGNGWIKGRFMMTKAVNQFETQAPKIVERKWQAFLSEALNGK